MRESDVKDKVAAHEMFAQLGREEIDELLGATDGIQEAADGDILMKEGEVGNALMLLLTGKCDVVKGLKTGKEHRLGTAESVDVLGELSLLLDDPRVATVRANGPVRYVMLGRPAFERMLEDGSPAARSLLVTIARQVARRHRDTVEKVAEMLVEPKDPKRKARLDLSHVRRRFERPLTYHI